MNFAEWVNGEVRRVSFPSGLQRLPNESRIRTRGGDSACLRAGSRGGHHACSPSKGRPSVRSRALRTFPSVLRTHRGNRAAGLGRLGNQRFRHPGVWGGRGCSQHRTRVSVRPNPEAIETRGRRARPWLDCWISVLQRAWCTVTSPCLMRDLKKTSAIHRHERHHHHGTEKAA